jgi:hypothetical protein
MISSRSWISKIIFLFLALFIFLSALEARAQFTICHRYNKLNPAQEPSMGPRCRVVKNSFYFDGMVTEDLFYELRDHYPHVTHLELNSYGGLVAPAYKIAELVRERQMTTNVRKGAKCASACTLIFQAGVKRTAHPSVRFLYHGARLSNLWVQNWLETRLEVGRSQSREELARQFSEVQEESSRFFKALIHYGMAPEFIEYYKSLPEDPNWFVDGNFTRTVDLIIESHRLKAFNIVQGFDTRDEVPEVESEESSP